MLDASSAKSDCVQRHKQRGYVNVSTPVVESHNIIMRTSLAAPGAEPAVGACARSCNIKESEYTGMPCLAVP